MTAEKHGCTELFINNFLYLLFFGRNITLNAELSQMLELFAESCIKNTAGEFAHCLDKVSL